MTRGLVGHARDFGFHSQCSQQPLKALMGIVVSSGGHFHPFLLALVWRVDGKKERCPEGEAFEEATDMQMLSTMYPTWF